MSRENDNKIATWLGFSGTGLPNSFGDKEPCNPFACHILPTPNYSTSDADAITLLPELVKRWHEVALEYNKDIGEWQFYIPDLEHGVWGLTISGAICAAVLELIDKEEAE